MGAKKKPQQAAPVERVERWAIAKLLPYLNNPRQHPAEQIEQIAASMRQFGQAQLIVVDDKGEIIAGHGRLLGAQKLGWSHVIVGVAVGWSNAQKRAYRVADNQIGLTSRWDDQLLRLEVGDLKKMGVDLSLLAFEPGMLQALSLTLEKGESDMKEAWREMPVFDQFGKPAFRSLMVHFRDQAALDKFVSLIGCKLSDKSKYIWFPEMEVEVGTDKRFAAVE